jgi:head-tail adaptor
MSIGNVAAYLTQTATVMRNNPTSAATGALINTWTSQSQVLGRLRPLVAYRWGSELISADKVTDQANYRWYCATSADITPSDQLRIGSNTYRVVYVADVMSMGRLMEVDVRLVAHDG